MIKNFKDEIEKIYNNGAVSYLDAIMHFTEKHNIEPEAIASIISRNNVLKSRLQQEAEDLNIIEKTSRLPI